MENNLKYRMYGLVPGNISPIQQGIQFGHGVVEYMLKYPIHLAHTDTEQWAEEDKTFIILNGGTTNTNGSGTLNQHRQTLLDNNIEISTFYEPDLGDQLTSVNFLVDERVWDKVKYPDLKETFYNFDIQLELKEYWERGIGGQKNIFFREFLKQFRLA